MLPIDKFDLASIGLLERMPEELVEPYLPQLLSWLQDGNWPIAKPLGAVLGKMGSKVVPSLLDVLHGTDSAWKYWCIELLVKQMPHEARKEIQSQLIALASSPSADDEQEEVHLVAQEALQGM